VRRLLDLVLRLAGDARDRLTVRDVTLSTPTLLRRMGDKPREIGDPLTGLPSTSAAPAAERSSGAPIPALFPNPYD
jgi:hypothetical protein